MLYVQRYWAANGRAGTRPETTSPGVGSSKAPRPARPQGLPRPRTDRFLPVLADVRHGLERDRAPSSPRPCIRPLPIPFRSRFMATGCQTRAPHRLDRRRRDRFPPASSSPRLTSARPAALDAPARLRADDGRPAAERPAPLHRRKHAGHLRETATLRSAAVEAPIASRTAAPSVSPWLLGERQ